jgi:hypothetical protein
LFVCFFVKVSTRKMHHCAQSMMQMFCHSFSRMDIPWEKKNKTNKFILYHLLISNHRYYVMKRHMFSWFVYPLYFVTFEYLLHRSTFFSVDI